MPEKTEAVTSGDLSIAKLTGGGRRPASCRIGRSVDVTSMGMNGRIDRHNTYNVICFVPQFNDAGSNAHYNSKHAG